MLFAFTIVFLAWLWKTTSAASVYSMLPWIRLICVIFASRSSSDFSCHHRSGAFQFARQHDVFKCLCCLRCALVSAALRGWPVSKTFVCCMPACVYVQNTCAKPPFKKAMKANKSLALTWSCSPSGLGIHFALDKCASLSSFFSCI